MANMTSVADREKMLSVRNDAVVLHFTPTHDAPVCLWNCLIDETVYERSLFRHADG